MQSPLDEDLSVAVRATSDDGRVALWGAAVGGAVGAVLVVFGPLAGALVLVCAGVGATVAFVGRRVSTRREQLLELARTILGGPDGT